MNILRDGLVFSLVRHIFFFYPGSVNYSTQPLPAFPCHMAQPPYNTLIYIFKHYRRRRRRRRRRQQQQQQHRHPLSS